MLDVDDFKSYNDNYGHQEGDDILRTIAGIMDCATLRSSDQLCRFGGEEFILLLPETDISGALQVAENMRRRIEKKAMRHEFARASTVITISAGVAEFEPGADATLESLIKQADDALYLAKESGKNCVMASAVNKVKPDCLKEYLIKSPSLRS